MRRVPLQTVSIRAHLSVALILAVDTHPRRHVHARELLLELFAKTRLLQASNRAPHQLATQDDRRLDSRGAAPRLERN